MPEPSENKPLGTLDPRARILRTTLIGDLLLSLAAVGGALILAVNPSIGHVGGLGDGQQLVAAKACRRFPFLAVLVVAGQRDVVPRPVVGLVGPDRGLDATEADFVGRPLLAIFLGSRRRFLGTVLDSHWETILS